MGLVGKGLGKILGAIAGAIAVVATAAGIKGISDNSKAKKINNQAKQIESNAIAVYDQSFKSTNEVLCSFGKEKQQAVDKIIAFAELIEKIQEKPTLSNFSHSDLNLKDIDIEQMRIVSNDLRMAASSSVGAVGGVLVGFAVFGFSFFAAAPAIAGGGFALFAKGKKIRKEAEENRRKAIKLNEDIKKIVKFYEDVSYYTQSLNNMLTEVCAIHDRYFETVSNILEKKTEWNLFTTKEITCIQICILLTGLMARICNTRIIIQSQSDDVLDQIDKDSISKTQNYVYGELAKMPY